MATCKDCLHTDCYDQSLEDAESCNFFLDKEDYRLVVMCKDCIHMEKSAQFRHCRVWGAINGMGDEGFCNYGERKET